MVTAMAPTSNKTAARARRRANKGGRPTLLTDEVQTAIIDSIRAGNFAVTACGTAHVHYGTYLNWITAANEARAQLANGLRLTAHQERLLAFSEALNEAEHEAESTLLDRVAMAGQPRRVRKVTIKREPLKVGGNVVRDAEGNPVLVTTTTTEEHEEYDWRASLEVLKRRYGQRWGDKVANEISGPQGGPVRVVPQQDVDADTMREVVAAFAEAGLLDPQEFTESGAVEQEIGTE